MWSISSINNSVNLKMANQQKQGAARALQKAQVCSFKFSRQQALSQILLPNPNPSEHKGGSSFNLARQQMGKKREVQLQETTSRLKGV